MKKRRERHIFGQHQCADTLRPAHLMGGDGTHMNAERLDVDRRLARALHQIGGKNAACLAHEACCLFKRLNDTRLIIGVLQQHEGLFSGLFQQCAERVQIYQPIGEERNGPAFKRARLRRADAAGMLARPVKNGAAAQRIGLRGGKVHRFGARTRKDHPFGGRA